LRVPAVCDNCGTLFPSRIEAVNSTNVSFYGCGASPCPSCGGNGHIPDGVYNFIGNTIELLSGPARTISELEHLAIILKKIRMERASFQQVTQKISQEVPALNSLSDILPKTRGDLYPFIAIVLTIITIILGQLKSGDRQNIQINNVITNIYQQQEMQSKSKQLKAIEPSNNGSIRINKIGRNEPCPCGSGKKYKKCCIDKKRH
jgi:hypothetical protein